MRERLGFAYDEVNAVLAAGSDDLVDAVKRLEAVKAIRRTKNFEPLAVSFKRIRKIIEKAGPAADWQLAAVRPELFDADSERALHSSAESAKRKPTQTSGQGNIKKHCRRLRSCGRLSTNFFEDVLVMAENEEVRRNRLTLLANLLREFSTIADFSEIAAGENR